MNTLVTKPLLPEGTIDAGAGEAFVVRNCLSKFVDLEKGYFTAGDNLWTYPSPNGYKPLVDLLESKHNAKVIVTHGAKQALGATFYALSKMGHSYIGMTDPYWALIPPLAEYHKLESNFIDVQDVVKAVNMGLKDPYLLLAPNNPDGQCLDFETLKGIHMECYANNVPFVHDAAYFSHTYLPSSYELGPLGDVQIFSMSKSFGLSSLRLGYAVCHDEKYASYIEEYMEMMTVGVSSVTQQMLYNLLCWAKYYPEEYAEFLKDSFNALQNAKKIVKGINPEVLEVPENIENVPGMFLWAKMGPKADFAKAKINVIPGAAFGKAGYMRMNLALPEEQLKEIVERLNNL